MRRNRGNKEGNQQQLSFTSQIWFSVKLWEKSDIVTHSIQRTNNNEAVDFQVPFPLASMLITFQFHFTYNFICIIAIILHFLRSPTSFTQHLPHFIYLLIPSPRSIQAFLSIIPSAYRLPHIISFPILSFNHLVPSMLSLIIPPAHRLPQLVTFTFLSFHYLLPSMRSFLIIPPAYRLPHLIFFPLFPLPRSFHAFLSYIPPAYPWGNSIAFQWLSSTSKQ